MFLKEYDVIVVGGGHAGAEAASSATKMGAQTLLITMNLQTIGQMSCNPAMGGIAKGQIIREIDALGGLSGIITDKTMIQFRMLNKSKGPAMWSPRAQSDRVRFSKEWKKSLEIINNLDLFQGIVNSLILKNNKVIGVKTDLEIIIKGKSVILTNGTFLNGIIHIGKKRIEGGRISENSVKGITEQLKNFGFKYGRMKTGTSPRIDGKSINFSKMTEQLGDKNPGKFSFLKKSYLKSQRSCYITNTNTKVHDIIFSNIKHSPIYNGNIKGVGPRYCPSIEDKINRFSEKKSHQLFIEPEGKETLEFYVNGFSTSMPIEIQHNSLSKISGLEYVKIIKPGYSIEYDYFKPTQLKHSLETKIIENLFFAGQINGTTGYEEAAAQGLIAGINANLKINGKDAFTLKRNEAYIGVLIDDLVTKGTEEPYRMFTSRAEYRMLLRQDNADYRLTPLGYKLGLISNKRLNTLNKKKCKIRNCIDFFNKNNISYEDINISLNKYKHNHNNIVSIKKSDKISTILSRPEISIEDLFFIKKVKNFFIQNKLSLEDINEISILIKYKNYIEKEKQNVSKMLRLENISIPNWINYKKILNISSEAREKLNKIKPKSIAEAIRISGISPSDISILLIYMKR